MFIFIMVLLTQALYADIREIDALGRTVVLLEPARRIVSLSPAVTEILFAIGAGDKLVGRTEFCDYPAQAAAVPVVGGFSGATVSVERIALLKSDLVIVSADMHQKLIPLVKAAGAAVFAAEPRDFDGVYALIKTLGRLSGCERGADTVVWDMREKIARVERRVQGKPRPSVFWELFGDPLMTSGGATFVSEAVRKAGGRNMFENEKNQWFQTNAEQVLVRNPDWILSGSDHPLSAENLQKRPLWRSLNAVRNGRVASVVNAGTVYRYGPRLADAVVAIADILHPLH